MCELEGERETSNTENLLCGEGQQRWYKHRDRHHVGVRLQQCTERRKARDKGWGITGE